MGVFVERLLVGLFLLLANLFAIFSGSRTLLFLLTLLISSLAMEELYRSLFHAEGSPLGQGSFDWLFCHAMNLSVLLAAFFLPAFCVYLVFVAFFLLGAFHLLLDLEAKPATLAIQLAMGLYVSGLSSFVLFFPADRPYAFLLVLCVSWGSDTFAYAGGRLFGKHPLTPVSPKKTREGALAGSLGAVVLSLFVSRLFGSGAGLLPTALFALLASILAQAGDLFASRIKRALKIKDFGHILKAHGGILDRYDSVLFCLPLTWFFVHFFLS